MNVNDKSIRFIDLFCGIGGFRIAMQNAAEQLGLQAQCVFSSDINEKCQKVYAANFGHKPAGDITQISETEIPDHDVLLGGFPCQPFSICGDKKGFEDTRGTLFFDIARIIAAKKPAMFVLENVRMLVGHNGGQTLRRIVETLTALGYQTQHQVLNALDFGLPQKRERVFIVGFRNPAAFAFPEGDVPMRPLAEILEQNVDRKHYASEHIRNNRLKQVQPTAEPTIWHENKSGLVCARPYSCALRAGASHNYLLVNGERRLTGREALRLQGYPDSFKIVCSDRDTRSQAGNSVAIPVVTAVLKAALEAQQRSSADAVAASAA